MAAALAHRGPDGEGLWCSGPAAFGHRMLQTTAESTRELQPLVDEEAGLVLVADARLDNRDSLLTQLSLSSAAADVDIVHASYRRWGDGCPEKLIGDFAFALWDLRARSLFCARDAMGVKPFYFIRDPRRFIFATEVKALRAARDVTLTIDPERLALFLAWQHDDRDRTTYREVFRLPAACTLRLWPDRMTVRQYWSATSASEVRFSSNAQYAEAFHEVFRAATEARLRCVHPVGATLSGGLDSSSIVCMARKRGGVDSRPLHTYSIIFPGLPEKELRTIDERGFVEAVVKGGGVEPHYVRGDALSPMRDARRILWHLDEPYSAPNLYLQWSIYEAAGANNVRVLLDGFDGDSAVSHGFTRLSGLARASQWHTLEAEVRQFSAHHAKSPAVTLEHFVLPYLAELAEGGRIPSWLRMERELVRRFGLSRREVALGLGVLPFLRQLSRGLLFSDRGRGLEAAMLHPSLARTLRRHERAKRGMKSRRKARCERDAHAAEISQPLYQLVLEMADKAAAAFGIEPRYPFFDRRLIEFCVGLPEEQKFAGGWPRLVFRRAMEGTLPPEIQWRSTKANLAPNFHRRFRSVDVADNAVIRGDPLSPYLRVERLLDFVNQYRSGSGEVQPANSAFFLFRAAVLEKWLDQVKQGAHHTQPEAGVVTTAAA